MPICQVSVEAKLEKMQERIQEQQLDIPIAGSYGPGEAQPPRNHHIQLQDEGQKTAIMPAKLSRDPRIFIQASHDQLHSQLICINAGMDSHLFWNMYLLDL